MLRERRPFHAGELRALAGPDHRTLFFGFRRHAAMNNACNSMSVVRLPCSEQPMTSARKQVDHHGQKGKALLVRMQVMPVTDALSRT